MGLMASQETTDAIVKALGVEVRDPDWVGGYQFDCKKRRSLPDMHVEIGPFKIRWRWQDYSYMVGITLIERSVF